MIGSPAEREVALDIARFLSETIERTPPGTPLYAFVASVLWEFEDIAETSKVAA